MNEEIPDGEEGVPLPEPVQPAGEIVPFLGDENLDLNPLPSLAELMANGGRLLITLSLREMPYAEYLKTNHWQQKRSEAFRVYGRRCFVGVECEGVLDVHHDRYENRGDEPMEDLQILCRLHHWMKHEAGKAFVRAHLAQQFNRE